MNRKFTKQLAAGMIAFSLCALTALAQSAPKMKMTTDIPEAITTPDSVETRLGTLKFFDGFPDDATTSKVYDNLDFMRGVKAFLDAVPGASAEALRTGWGSQGADNNSDRAHHGKPDGLEVALSHAEYREHLQYDVAGYQQEVRSLSKRRRTSSASLMTTGSSMWPTLETAGPDKGKGGKYLLLPPGYSGEVPEGYIVLRSANLRQPVLLARFSGQRQHENRRGEHQEVPQGVHAV